MFKSIELRLSAALLALSISSNCLAEEVAASQFSCAELEAKVSAAGTLVIVARNFNPMGGESEITSVFVSSTAECKFQDEEATKWEIYAKDGQICRTLLTCMPRPPRF
jgi:hypothetical protein